MRRVFLIYSIILSSFASAECYELNYSDCLYWSAYCEWNEDTGQCQNIGGGSGGGDENAYGPYTTGILTESDGLRNGPDYDYARLYYPINANYPYKSIIMTPGWGDDGSYLSVWGEFLASYGFIAMIIGPNDPINDDHQVRGQGLIDAMETIRQENYRMGSPIYELIDIQSFSVGGYSMGGGAAQAAAMLDNSIKAIISLNPTLFVYDTINCDAPYYYCLIPEHLDHSVPTLIFAGQTELNEMGQDYDGFLGQTIYEFIPNTTDKILFEVANQGHGAAAEPEGEIADIIIDWFNYQVLDDALSCNELLSVPSNASQYLINIDCIDEILGDINGDSFVNIQDIILTVNYVLSGEYSNSADFNSDGNIDILDIVQLVNIILN
tara:strand:- start:2312 stop:3451 length:1140 start_codon:yes stop_codon:yes gene_type:complete